MSKVLYFLTTFTDSGLSVFGLRGVYDQPAYHVVQTIAPGVEIRDYAPRTVVETDVVAGDQGQAFGRLFRYITGANTGKHLVSMTVPVEQATPATIPMTLPVETNGTTPVMRFFLPQAVVKDGPPQPTEHGVRLATIPAETLAVIRYSGTATDATRTAETAKLRSALQTAGRVASGAPRYFSYDPPFAIPFLRRNEVALEVK